MSFTVAPGTGRKTEFTVSPNASSQRLGGRPLKQYKYPIGGEVHVQTYGYQVTSPQERESSLKSMGREATDLNLRRQLEASPAGGATTGQLHSHRVRGRGAIRAPCDSIKLGDDDVTDDYRTSTARETFRQVQAKPQSDAIAGVPSGRAERRGVKTGYYPSTANPVAPSEPQDGSMGDQEQEKVKIVAPRNPSNRDAPDDSEFRAGLSSVKLAERKPSFRPVSQPSSAREELRRSIRTFPQQEDHVQIGDGKPYFETTTKAEYDRSSIDPDNARNPLLEAVSPEKPHHRPSTVDPSLGRPGWEVRRPQKHIVAEAHKETEAHDAIYGTDEAEVQERPRTGRRIFADHNEVHHEERPQRWSKKFFHGQQLQQGTGTAVTEIGAHSDTMDRPKPGDFSGKKILTNHNKSSIVLG